MFDNYKVLLIGVGRYGKKNGPTPIPNVYSNIRLLKELLLKKSLIGIPKGNIKILNTRSNTTKLAIETELVDFVSKTKKNDTLIVYYSGHGIISSHDYNLYLTTYQTELKEKLEVTSINSDDFKSVIKRSKTKRRIIILDCCYSGKFIDKMGSLESQIQAQVIKNNQRGTFFMASSDEYTPSIFDPKNPKSPTKFTGTFINVLNSGLESENEYCSVGEVFSEVSAILELNNLPVPIHFGFEFGNELLICKNLLYKSKQPEKVTEEVEKKIDKQNTVETEVQATSKPQKSISFVPTPPMETKINSSDKETALPLIIRFRPVFPHVYGIRPIYILSFSAILLIVCFLVPYFFTVQIPQILKGLTYVSLFISAFAYSVKFLESKYSLVSTIESVKSGLSVIMKRTGKVRGHLRKMETLVRSNEEELRKNFRILAVATEKGHDNQIVLSKEKIHLIKKNNAILESEVKLYKIYSKLCMTLLTYSEVLLEKLTVSQNLLSQRTRATFSKHLQEEEFKVIAENIEQIQNVKKGTKFLKKMSYKAENKELADFYDLIKDFKHETNKKTEFSVKEFLERKNFPQLDNSNDKNYDSLFE